jgi:pimeloyl-ACP methyl ester carboxylesterase
MTSIVSLTREGQLTFGPTSPSQPEDQVVPIRLHVPDTALNLLRERVAETRLPERQTVPGWTQGVPLDELAQLLDYWRDEYDWRQVEHELNNIGQYRTVIDGLGIHFLHVRSRHADALPLLLTHGWPGSVLEFLATIEPLTDPTAHGGTPDQAFHVVIPSLPGYGLSDKPTEPGWGLSRIARAWHTLMNRLGYHRYVAQGGDLGAGVATAMAKQRPDGLAGIHLNLAILFAPPPLTSTVTAEEQRTLDQLTEHGRKGSAYALQQTTRPQTLGYALADSPAGQAAWIYEKIATWTDSNLRPEQVLTRRAILDNITLYWLTNTATSAARLYYESFDTEFVTIELDLPVGVSVFPRELYRAPRIWADRVYRNLYYWNDTIDRGGHFAAWEQPRIFVDELRECFAQLR